MQWSPIPKRGFTFRLVTFLVTLQEQTPQPLIGQIFDRFTHAVSGNLFVDRLLARKPFFISVWFKYIDLAKAKSKALLNIDFYSLRKQNIKLCNAKRQCPKQNSRSN